MNYLPTGKIKTTNNMKYLFFLLLLVVSCVKSDIYNYKVINESGVPIEVRFYKSYPSEKQPIITKINTGDTLEKIYQDNLPPRGYSFNVFFGDDSGSYDSLNIIYNQNKIAMFAKGGCKGGVKNPLNRCEYNGLNVTFVFTEQDYLDAEDCNGNCN